MSGGQWEDLRRQARQLENELDLKLISFAKLGANMGGNNMGGDYGSGGGLACPSSPTREQAEHIVETMSLEIQRLLDRLSILNERMADCINNGVSSESAFMHTLQRHRDIYTDYQREFEKTRSNIITLREREDLLGSVHRDIEAYRSGNSALMSEQQHLINSERLVDQHLSLAASVRHSLMSQRSVFRSVSGRMAGMVSRFPLLNSLVQRINFRKRRDAIVLAGVITCCMIIMLVYIFS